MKLVNFLLEDSDKYDFGCVMLYFDFPEIKNIHNMINPDDVYYEKNDRTYGLEDEPHVTLLYGLHDSISDEIIERVVENIDFGVCRVFNPSLFINQNYDVLKFDVVGKGLYHSNEKLKELPHTSNFPKYHPHMTIGYLKPGEGEKYVEKLQNLQFRLTPEYVIYSKTNGDRIKLEINT